MHGTRDATDNDGAPDDGRRLAVLMLDYEMAREDDRSTMSTQATILSVAVALLLGIGAIVSQACAYELKKSCVQVPDALLAAVPLAPLAMVGYLQMIGTAGTIRNYYMRALERELREQMGGGTLAAVPGLPPASYSELLTVQISQTRGSLPYRFIGFFIVGALLVLFGGLTVYIATGVDRLWATLMLIVYGTAALMIAAEARQATVGGRTLLGRLVARVSLRPDLLMPHAERRYRSLASAIVVPRARFDEAVKRLYIPAAFLLGAAARDAWDEIDWLRAVIVFLTFEFLLYDARYQWNDIRNYEEDGANRRFDRLPHSEHPEGSVEWLRENRQIVTTAVWAVVARVVLAVGLCVALLESGLVWAAGLTLAVSATAALYERLRAQRRRASVWAWVGVGYGVRAALGVVLAGYALLSAVSALTFATMTAFGVMAVTIVWAIQELGKCDGPREAATLHGESPPHLEALLPHAGVTVATHVEAPPPGTRHEGADWRIERRAGWRDPAPWEPALLVAAAAGAALGLFLAEPGPPVGLVIGAVLLGMAGATLATSASTARSSVGAALAVAAPGVAAVLAGSAIDGLVGLAPNLLVVGLYVTLRAKTAATLTPDLAAFKRRAGLLVAALLLGRRTAAHLGLRAGSEPAEAQDAARS